MGEFSLSHILILAAVLIVFFGPSRLPGVAKGLGEAIRDFKKSLNSDEPPPPSAERLADKNTTREKEKQS